MVGADQWPDSVAGLEVIVVDDDAYIVNLVRQLLDDIGVAGTRVATDGASLLRQLDGRPAHTVILDVNMPGMDGLEVLRHLAGRADRPSLILMSAENERILQTAHQLAQAHQLDVLGALGKPVRRPMLEELLASVVNGRRTAGGRRAAKALELTPEQVADGLRDGAVVPWFQPKVYASSRKLHGVEALARWRQDDGQVLPPSAFIPVAERSGLMKELTRRMMEVTLGQAGQWHRRGNRLNVAVNVSVLDVEDLDFFDFMTRVTSELGVSPASVTLEVTESRIVDRLTSALETLTRLSLRRFQLSLDDYGTGASTLDQVRRLPVDELKIDRAFVDGAASDDKLRAMLESTINLARQLDLVTVAEGVESDADWRVVRELGVDLVQGYAIAPPMPAAQFEEWMASWPG